MTIRGGDCISLQQFHKYGPQSRIPLAYSLKFVFRYIRLCAELFVENYCIDCWSKAYLSQWLGGHAINRDAVIG